MIPDEMLRLDSQLCFPLYAASRLLTQTYRPHLEKLGLTYLQYLVLLVLWETDGKTVGEIGERLLLDSGTLTPVLQRLERAGLLLRLRCPEDERSVECRLTTEGRRLKRTASRVPPAMLGDIGLTLEEVGRLKQELCAFVATLQRPAAARSATGRSAIARSATARLGTAMKR